MGAFLRSWRGLTKRGRCRYCRQAILWITTDENKLIPIQVDAEPLRTDVHPETFAKFDVYSWAAAHRSHCAGKRPPPKRAAGPVDN